MNSPEKKPDSATDTVEAVSPVGEAAAKTPRKMKQSKPPVAESAAEADTSKTIESETEVLEENEIEAAHSPEEETADENIDANGTEAVEEASDTISDVEPSAVNEPEADSDADAEQTSALPDDANEGTQTSEDTDVESMSDEAAISVDDEVEPETDSTEDGEGVPSDEIEPLVDVELTEAIEDEGESTEGEEKPTAEVDASAAQVEPKSAGKDDKQEKKNGGSRRVDSLFDFIELFVFTLAAVLFISAFFVRHSVVDGDSMLGTLHSGENLLISDFMYTPERGDVVVVEDLSTILKKPIIKRIIALGGDTVRITRHGVIVNGEPLVEDYVYTDEVGYVYEIYPSEALMTNETLIVSPGEYYEFVVPEGELFIMGDHRNKSTDSREIGTVDEDAVIGRVVLRFYPFDKFGKVE